MEYLPKWHQIGSTFTLKDYQEPLMTKSMSFFLKSSYLLASCDTRPYIPWNSLLGDSLPLAFYTACWVCREWKDLTTLYRNHSSGLYLQPATLRDEEMFPPQIKIQDCLQIAIKWQVHHSSTVMQLTECADIHLDPLTSLWWSQTWHEIIRTIWL